MLLVLSVALILWIIYSAGWRPLQQWHDHALRAKAQAESNWQWLLKAVEHAPVASTSTMGSMESVQALKAHLPPGAQLQQQGDQIIVTLHQTPITAWQMWIQRLVSQSLIPQSVRITLDARQGINGRLVFVRGNE